MTKYKPEWVEQAQNEGKHPFFITIPVIKEYHKQDITTILGLGTAVERSRTGHRMSQEFVDKLKQVSKGKHLFINHNPDQIAGKITGVKEGRPDEILPIAELLTPHDNPIVDAPRAKVEHWIKNKVQLGLSFGGTADKIKTTREENGNITYDVQDGELMEWSVTPINAVKRSDGSVKALDGGCPGGICQQIATQIEQGVNLPEIIEEDMTVINQSTGYILNQEAMDNAMSLIKQGDVDLDTPWNAGTYESEFESESKDPKLFCLGINPTSDLSEYSEKYRFRIGFDGKIYKQALIAVLNDVEFMTKVYESADKLLQMIYSKPSEEGINEYSKVEQVKEEMEDINMSAELENKVETLTQLVQTLVEKDAEKERKEAELKQEKEIQKRIDDALEEQSKTFKEATVELINEEFGKILKDKQGVTQKSEEGDKDVKKALEQDTKKKIEDVKFNDPVNYPAVLGGKVVQGKTPSGLFTG